MVCYAGCRIKGLFKYDDSLDTFGVHGVGGALGAILVGLFVVRPSSVDGGWAQAWIQLQAVLASGIYCFVMTLIICYAIKLTIGLRVKEQDEIDGLDIVVHGEAGYNLSESFGAYVEGAEGHPDARGTGVGH
jgi:Amt family ammonium transporter